MLIYRIQNKRGFGPYSGGTRHRDRFTSHERHPSPRDDAIIFGTNERHSDYYYGFKDITSLVQWFGGGLRKLHQEGYMLSIWDVKDENVKIGRKQACFKPHHLNKPKLYDLWTVPEIAEKIYVPNSPKG